MVEDVPVTMRVRQLDTWVAGIAPETPVFAWVHVFEPHEPYEPAAVPAGAPAVERYDGEVAAADAGVGALVRAFRARRPRATVIVTADHGEEFADHGGSFHGTTLYQEQVHVPLIWSSPDGVRARRIAAPVETIDLAVTLLAAAGVPRDPRMRGDDLGPLLRGSDEGAPRHAFAEIGDERMVSDGRYKAICTVGVAECRVYDLVEDPAERRNLGPSRPEVEQRLRAALSEMVASIARVETEAERGWPEALARAELGDLGAAPDVVPLLGSERAEVRAAAARAMARLGHAAALPVLARLREDDPDPTVRAESAIASLVLGDDAATRAAATLAMAPNATSVGSRDAGAGGRDAGAGGRDAGATAAGEVAAAARANDLARRAALALAARGDASGAETLQRLAVDAAAPLETRRAAVRALGALRVRAAVPDLIELLSDLALRTDAAEAIGSIGERRAGDALVTALSRERYPATRAAQARALIRLRDRRAAEGIRAWLGEPGALPGAVELLLEAGALARPSGAGADLRARAAGTVRRGTWTCEARGCRPGESAVVVLPARGAPVGQVVAVWRVDAAGPGVLRVDGVAVAIAAGAHEVMTAWPADREVDVAVEGDVSIVAVAIGAQ